MISGDLLARVQARPERFGLDGSYRSMATFLIGFDLGNSGGILRGFNEWLVVKLGHATSLGWSSLVLQMEFPCGEVRTADGLSSSQERRAVDRLFSLLSEFATVRESPMALAEIYSRYLALQELGE
ncbi:hypothetical protein AB0469_39570 [Streptomyces sp. NPDC093801]|uniref:hypothetical protein n=1 Tax=Streptomyces sp. NPDC093801 TaxID=3155203 RepID=UPI00344C0605